MKTLALIGVLATSIILLGESIDLSETSSPSLESSNSHSVDLLDRFI